MTEVEIYMNNRKLSKLEIKFQGPNHYYLRGWTTDGHKIDTPPVKGEI